MQTWLLVGRTNAQTFVRRVPYAQDPIKGFPKEARYELAFHSSNKGRNVPVDGFVDNAMIASPRGLEWRNVDAHR
jgi:hypothetical protein